LKRLEIEFVWDPKKAKRNLTKHRVSFETAKQVFFDPHLIVVEDCEFESEVRYHALGYAGSGPLLLTVFADRSHDDREIIRIISAPEADQYEQRTYVNQFEEEN
jgi:uncharacterized DUF497 family protein